MWLDESPVCHQRVIGVADVVENAVARQEFESLCGLLDRAGADPSRAVAMVCGPEVMMRFALADLGRLGLPEAATWISMERNMHCAVGLCGHCQLGPAFVCRDGPVFRAGAVAWALRAREV